MTRQVHNETGGGTTRTTPPPTGGGGTHPVALGSDVSGTLAIGNGGTGQVTQQAAIDALTAVSGATNEHVLTKDTASGNAIFKASAGGVTGPGSSTDNEIPRWNGTSGDTLQGSDWTLSDLATSTYTLSCSSGSPRFLNIQNAGAEYLTTQIEGEGRVLDLIGDTAGHVYVNWYPQSVASGRKAYMGYPSAASTEFRIVQQDSGAFHVRNEGVGDIEFNPSGGGDTHCLAGDMVVDAGNVGLSGHILDTNSNELISFTATGSAVNNLGITNAATGNAPVLSAEGEANLGFTINDTNGNEVLALSSIASAVTYVDIRNSITGNGPLIQAAGEANVDLKLVAAGTGDVIVAVGDLSVSAGSVSASNNSNTWTLDSTSSSKVELDTGTATRFALGGSCTNMSLNGATLYGDTTAGADMTLSSTSSATKGNIHFSTAAGRMSYDETNGRLGIGDDAPAALLEIYSNNAGVVDGIVLTGDGASNAIKAYCYKNPGNTRIEQYRARGSEATPLSVANGDKIGLNTFYGLDASSPKVFQDRAQFRVVVNGTVSGTSVPMDLELRTGTTALTTRWTIDSAGDLTGASGNELHFAQDIVLDSDSATGDFIVKINGTQVLAWDTSASYFWLNNMAAPDFTLSGTPNTFRTVTYSGSNDNDDALATLVQDLIDRGILR